MMMVVVTLDRGNDGEIKSGNAGESGNDNESESGNDSKSGNDM